MSSCAAYGCTNRPSKKIPGITFHSFPKDPNRRELWVKAVRRVNVDDRKEWTPASHSKLCSIHFDEAMIDRTSLSCVRLRENAVPEIFKEFPSYLQKKSRPRKPPTKRCSSDSIHSESVFCLQSVINEERPGPLINDSNSEELSASSTSININKLLEQSVINEERPGPLINDSNSEELSASSTSININKLLEKTDSTQQYKRKIESLNEIIYTKNKRIKTLQQKVRRYTRKVKDLKSLLDHLKSKNYIDDDIFHVLNTVSAASKDLVVRQRAKAENLPLPKSYAPEIRTFALTLHFYSPKAYQYVRESFNLSLPHPRTLARWYSHIDGNPGFTKEVLTVLGKKVEQSEYPLLFALSMDEMSIRQQIEFDGKDYYGFVNMGTAESSCDHESLPEARDAFVLLLTCINDSWKIPVGYFLTDSLKASQKKSIIEHCLVLCHEINVKIVSLTFDGLSTNFLMANLLGCDLDDPKNLKTTFPHPCSPNEEIVVFPDPPHMLKLVRNALGERKILFSSGYIEWKYLKDLHDLQVSEGLHLGNKLRASHINFFKQKMKVNLAAQLFSLSVADALVYCRDKLKLEKFKGCAKTVEFLRIFNNVFDILNSRSMKQYAFKKATSLQNVENIYRFLTDAESYILSLKECENGQPMVCSRRKTGFVGFLVCFKSYRFLVEQLIKVDNAPLKYLPLYKLGQDHLELFFSAIRNQGGRNDNPTARQFLSAYRKLLVNTELKHFTGNCIPQSEVTILCAPSKGSSLDTINITSHRFMAVTSDKESVELDEIFHSGILSECSKDIVYYISGFVVKTLTKSLKCSDCIAAIHPSILPNTVTFVSFKSNGKLVHPSSDVVKICEKCESWFRQISWESNVLSDKKQHVPIPNITKIFEHICSQNFFPALQKHQFDNNPLDNHLLHLIRSIIQLYFKVRLNYYYKNLKNTPSIRQHLTKTILFKGQ